MNDRPGEQSKLAIESKILHGKHALVLGIANEHSIAYGCARIFRQLGADLAVTYLNEGLVRMEPLAKELGASIFVACDVGRGNELDAVFQRIRETWEASTLPFIPSPSRRRRTSRGGSSTAPARGSRWRWTFPLPFLRPHGTYLPNP